MTLSCPLTLKYLTYLLNGYECAGELWGYQLPNGTWTGLVGMFASGKGDIGIADLFITLQGGRHVHQAYTSPYGQQVPTVFLYYKFDYKMKLVGLCNLKKHFICLN